MATLNKEEWGEDPRREPIQDLIYFLSSLYIEN